MRKRTTRLLLFYFLFTAGAGFPPARADDPYNDPGDRDTIGEDPDAQEVPLDSGVVLLLATGVVYGLKKYSPAVTAKK